MDTSEESGEPIPVTKTGTGAEATTPPPIIITPPPLSQAQVEKIVDAIEAIGEAAEALGSLYGQYCKWVLNNFKPMLIPPLVPPAIIPESTSPP